MASDFGDESGQRLLDDFVRFGQQAGIERMRERAYAVRRACDHARAGALAQAGRQDAPWVEPREWAKLDMHEFQGIEGYERIKGVIESKLSAHGAEFHWHADEVSGKEHLLFKIRDAREVWESFGELSREAGEACEKAAEEVQRPAGREAAGRGEAGRDRNAGRGEAGGKDGAGRDEAGAPRDTRALEERAEHARAASAALAGERPTTRARAREPRMQEVRSK